jgi:hypothetical protein
MAAMAQMRGRVARRERNEGLEQGLNHAFRCADGVSLAA